MSDLDFKLQFHMIVLNLVSRRLYIGDSFVFLRNKEFLLLEYFIKNSGKVLSRTKILEEVWDRNVFCPTNTVDVHVSNLRRKLKHYNCPDYIKTIHCVGYIFDT